MEEIYRILSDLRPENDFAGSVDFISDGLLDSFDIVSLVSALEEQYSVLIDALDIIPENFVSVSAIASMVQKNGATL